MVHSLVTTNIWDEEVKMFTDQEHLEKVWGIMLPIAQQNIDDYLEKLSHSFDKSTPNENYAVFLEKLISGNDKLHDKYHQMFSMELMDEYSEDTDSFKSTILKKDCDVIRKSLQSNLESLNEWKSKFYSCKSQKLYDSFYNMLLFAKEYDQNMTEEKISSLNEIKDSGLGEMEEDSCYQTGVLGYGIVSNILNHMYPRVFPGNYKAGIYSLYFLTGKKGQYGIDMPSQTSEFCMVKDDVKSKTGIVEMEHNYYYPYETFDIYTIRIYREITSKINSRFHMYFPNDYRFLLTNDFYDYITVLHQEEIATLAGNDDILKFSTIW